MTPHILILADGRSPTAQSWIENIQALAFEVSLISTYPCDPLNGLKYFHILPIAYSRYSSKQASVNKKVSNGPLTTLIRRFTPLFQKMRHTLGPLSLLRYKETYQDLVLNYQPDLVHALRIPFEGMLGSYTPSIFPFIAATWGNDLTLHARGSWLMRRFTQRCLQRADGLTSDTHRDVRLAQTWGLDKGEPTLVIPGSGGVDLEKIRASRGFEANGYGIPVKSDWVVNPRGLRPGSVHQEIFFAAMPQVLAQRPQTVFICPGLEGIPQAEAWLDEYSSRENTFLLPKLPQTELWGLFNQSQLFVSPSSHDGTPNTLLEAMACGCFPILGDIESLREWIEHGINGLLVNPRDPQELANAIIEALDQPDLRQNAADINLTVIKNRAAQRATQPMIKNFYAQILTQFKFEI